MPSNFKQLQRGDRVRMLGFVPTCDLSHRQRLMSMGFVQGTEFSVIGKALFGDPLLLAVRDGVIALRKKEIGFLRLEMI